MSERVFICECGNIMDRDINAAINIREEGKRLVSA
ncbi:MAG: zinc ribbon domain-containing protein [Suipraeoptans sp.]